MKAGIGKYTLSLEGTVNWKNSIQADLIACKITNETYLYIRRFQFKGKRLGSRKTNTLYLLCAIIQLTVVSTEAEATNSKSGERTK
jgi:hypothetical protein